MSRARALIAVLLSAAGILLWTEWPSRAAAGPFDKAVVRLYSNGQVVGEWEAVGPGKVQDGTLVFPVRQGVRDLEVRIRGTYSFEVQP
jgi:hypothetical protein